MSGATNEENRTGDLKTAVRHAMTLFARGELELASEQSREILRAFPAEPNSAFILAAASRARGDAHAAHTALEVLVSRVPDFALAWQELAFARVDLGATEAAKAALMTAIATDKPLPQSWRLLAELSSAEGDSEAAAAAADQFALAQATDPRLVEAVRLARAGQLAQAERECRRYVHDRPDDVTAIRLLADIGVRVGALEDSENLFRRCLELAPDFTLARLNYAQLLSKRERLEEALAQVDLLLLADPERYPFLTLQASIYVKLGDFDRGIAVYERLLSRFPPRPMTTLVYGHALKTVGRRAEAIDAYRRTIALQPSFGDAYWSLANLKTFRFEEAELAAMRMQIDAGTGTLEDHFHLRFALGKALEDRGHYAESFEHYQRGNAIKVDTEHYSANQMTDQIERTIRTCSTELFAGHVGGGCAAPDPIFIVGLPRSGSTLLEQILASHSQVDGTKELLDIPAIVRRLSGRIRNGEETRYPEILAELDDARLRELGEEYLHRTRIQRGRAPYFVDKMPNNFRHIGLIRLILPNARIIDARRHPMAACFSCFTQLFAQGQSFTYGLTNIGRYYRDYLTLMDHWDRVLPGKVLRVQYEDMTAHTEREVRRLLEYCGLPFEEATLSFHRTERAVRTASSEQVRQPIYANAVDHWRHYEPWLDELKEALGPAVLERYPID
jgi:tetratricopeptide (TPR) repeat protein